MFTSGHSKENADQELDYEQPERVCRRYGMVTYRAVWPI